MDKKNLEIKRRIKEGKNYLIWCLKQLLPLRYETTFESEGVKHLTIWRMWFGRCFNVKEYKLA